MFGMSAEIQVPRMERCERCKGAGSEPGSGPSNCPTCHGRGEILYQQSFLSIRRTCSTCNGSGQIIRNPCTECHGHGYRQVQRKLKVNIPAGVDDGNRLRLAGEGQPGANGGPAGDLYVFLKVKEHAVLRAPGKRPALHHSAEYRAGCAGLRDRSADAGAAAQAQDPRRHPERRAVQAAPQGRRLLNSGARGDLYVHISVKMPTRLTREQRKLLEQLRDTLPVDNQPSEKGLFDKVKDYFM